MNFLMARERAPISHQGNKLAANHVCRWRFQTIDLFFQVQTRWLRIESTRAVNRATAIQADFRDVPLSVSFRSARPILDLVNKTIPDLCGIDDFTNHQMARSGAGGFVELWPVVKGNDDFGAETIAATQLARRVKSWIGNRRLPSGILSGR